MRASTQLFESEGRQNLKTTIANVAKAASAFDVETVVIFATNVDSVLKLRALVDDTRAVVAVTFPAGYTALIDDSPTLVGITEDVDREKLKSAGISIVQGIMPFEALGDADSSEARMFRSALGLFGGGLQLCVQAILMGCDAGVVPVSSRCISMSADTAIVAHSEYAFRFLSKQSRFSVEHIICKPVAYTVSRPYVKKPTGISRAVPSKSDRPRSLEASDVLATEKKLDD